MTGDRVVSRGHGVKQELDFLKAFKKGEKGRKYAQGKDRNERSCVAAGSGNLLFKTRFT